MKLKAALLHACDCYRKEDSDDETLREIDALLTSKATDDDQLTAVDGVDLGSHLDVFHTILKQVAVNFFSFHVPLSLLLLFFIIVKKT